MFFPPRLEVVALQQHPDRLPADLVDHLPFHRLFRDQADGPAGRPGGRIRAHHRDDALLLRRRQHFRRPSARPLVERPVAPTGPIELRNVAHGLRREPQQRG